MSAAVAFSVGTSTPFAGFDQVVDLAVSQINQQVTRVIVNILDSTRRAKYDPGSDVDEFLVKEYADRSCLIMREHHLPIRSGKGEDIQAMITRNLAVSDVYRIIARLFELFPFFLSEKLPRRISGDTIMSTMQEVAILLREASFVTTDETIGPLISACLACDQLSLLSETEAFSPDALLRKKTDVIDLVRNQLKLERDTAVAKDRNQRMSSQLMGRKLAHCATALRFAIQGPMVQTSILIAALIREVPTFRSIHIERYGKQVESINHATQTIIDEVLPPLKIFELRYSQRHV